MSQKTSSKRIMFLPDITEKLKVLSLKANSKARGSCRGGGAGGGESREREAEEAEDKVGAAADKSSSMKRLLRRFKTRMGRAMCFAAVPLPRRCPTSSKLVRHSVCPHDYNSSHRSEDIAECIDFINSSNSSLRGPN